MKAFDKTDWKLEKIIYNDPFPTTLVPVQMGDISTTTSTSGSFLKSIASKVEMTFGSLEPSRKEPPPNETDLLPACTSFEIWSKYEKNKIRPHEKELANRNILVQNKAEKLSDLALDVKYSERSERKVYLPVYEGYYVYNSATYKFYVNGHSEKVFGERPWGAGKVGEYSSHSVKAVGTIIKTQMH